MNQTFEQFCALKARYSFNQLPRKAIERPELVRFRGQVWSVSEKLPNNLLKVVGIRGFQKQIVHEFELDI